MASLGLLPSISHKTGHDTEYDANIPGFTKLAIHPSANATLVIAEFSDHFADLDVGELAGHLKDGLNDLSNNDLRQCEAMLYSQAHALQAIFGDSLLQVTK